MPTQQAAVTGRRIQPNYIAAINAQTPYLPALYAQRAEDAARERAFNLQEQNIARNQSLAEQQFEEQKEQQNRANLIGLGSLGTKIYFGRKANKALDVPLNTAPTGAAASASTPTGSFLSGLSNIGSKVKDFGSDLIDPAGYASALTGKSLGQNILRGGASAIIGPSLGEQFLPFGGKREKRIIGGGLTGAATGLASGGNIYDTAISTLAGALGGLF